VLYGPVGGAQMLVDKLVSFDDWESDEARALSGVGNQKRGIQKGILINHAVRRLSLSYSIVSSDCGPKGEKLGIIKDE